MWGGFWAKNTLRAAAVLGAREGSEARLKQGVFQKAGVIFGRENKDSCAYTGMAGITDKREELVTLAF